MTIEEIKSKLKRYRFIAGEISDLLDERERLRSLAEKITPSLSFAPVHGANTDKMAPVVANLIEVERYIEKRSKELLRARMEAEKLIALLDNPKHRQLLVKRYILGHKWGKICDDMSYEWNGIHKMHGFVLSSLSKRVQNSGEKLI